MSTARDAVRAALLGQLQNPDSQVITFFGQQIEVRQPPLSDIIDRGAAKVDAADMLIQYCYIPGTDEKVFEEADRDSLVQLPFGPDFQNFQKVIVALTGIDIAAETKKSDKTA